MELVQAEPDPLAEGRIALRLDEREEDDAGEPGEELHAEVGHEAERLRDREGARPGRPHRGQNAPGMLELPRSRHLGVYDRRAALRPAARPAEVVAKEAL